MGGGENRRAVECGHPGSPGAAAAPRFPPGAAAAVGVGKLQAGAWATTRRAPPHSIPHLPPPQLTFKQDYHYFFFSPPSFLVFFLFGLNLGRSPPRIRPLPTAIPSVWAKWRPKEKKKRKRDLQPPPTPYEAPIGWAMGPAWRNRPPAPRSATAMGAETQRGRGAEARSVWGGAREGPRGCSRAPGLRARGFLSLSPSLSAPLGRTCLGSSGSSAPIDVPPEPPASSSQNTIGETGVEGGREGGVVESGRGTSETARGHRRSHRGTERHRAAAAPPGDQPRGSPSPLAHPRHPLSLWGRPCPPRAPVCPLCPPAARCSP